MNYLLLLALSTALLFPTPSQSDTNHFGAGGIFELDLGDSEIPLTPKQVREDNLLAVLKSSFQDWHQPIALIHDCLKVLPNDMDKAKERIKHGFVQACKGDPLARLADERKCHPSDYHASRRVLEASQPFLIRLLICLIKSYFH